MSPFFGIRVLLIQDIVQFVQHAPGLGVPFDKVAYSLWQTDKQIYKKVEKLVGIREHWNTSTVMDVLSGSTSVFLALPVSSEDL
jgi:hypothetical protein